MSGRNSTTFVGGDGKDCASKIVMFTLDAPTFALGRKQLGAKFAVEAVKIGVGDMNGKMAVDVRKPVEVLATHIAKVGLSPCMDAQVIGQCTGMSKALSARCSNNKVILFSFPIYNIAFLSVRLGHTRRKEQGGVVGEKEQDGEEYSS